MRIGISHATLGDDAERHEQRAKLLTGLLLQPQRALERARIEFAALDQQFAKTFLQNRGIHAEGFEIARNLVANHSMRHVQFTTETIVWQGFMDQLRRATSLADDRPSLNCRRFPTKRRSRNFPGMRGIATACQKAAVPRNGESAAR